MNPISVRVSGSNQDFIEWMISSGKSKTEIVNNALDLLRKEQLQAELTDMAISDSEEDAKMAEEGMEDYLTLIEDAA